jgi:hypothetical protein
VDLVGHDFTLSIVSAQAGAPKFSVKFVVHSESNWSRHCIQSGNEMAVASDAFNCTFLTSLLLLYEYALSILFSLDHDPPLLVDNGLGAKPAEHDSATAFSDHE